MPVDKNCKVCKYKTSHSDKFGRYMVAAKDLTAGEVILREKPLVVGPAAFIKDYFCFGCLRLLLNVQKQTQYVCSQCKTAPLCGETCEKKVNHHTKEECEIFQKNKPVLQDNIVKIMNILLPLRLMLLKDRNPELWKSVELMESHVEERRNTPIWKDREINVVNVLRNLQFASKTDEERNEEATYDFLQQLCGILDVNSFELRSPGGLDGLLLRGLYNEASLMAHDCRGNTHITVDDDFTLTVYTSVPIKQDETVFFNYTSSLLGTAERREHLREGKYFECDCLMCKDPYEMGSHLSSIRCPRCREGFVGMQNPLSNNPYSRASRWQCNICRRTYGGYLIRATLNISRTLFEDCDESNTKDLESLVEKLNKTFHPNHFLLLALKQKLLAAYRKEVAAPNPPKKMVRRMTELCKEVFNVLEIVEPGISRLKGIMLYEMHLPLVLLANRAYAAREISAQELHSRLEEAQALLKKSLTMLLLEPMDTPEGRLVKRALQEFKMLNQNIADAKALSSEQPKTSSKKSKSKEKSKKR